MEHSKDESIDVAKDPFAYNKEFDPNNPEHFSDWLKMRPSHITEADWQFKLGELKEMLAGKNQRDASMIFLGWKVTNGLLKTE